MDNLEINNDLEKTINLFSDSPVGQVLNKAVDEALKVILPDSIEKEVIDVKNTLINEGLEKGVKNIINEAIEKAENIVNTITGNFDKISQPEIIISEGGFLDGISNVVNTVLDKMEEKNIISNEMMEILKKGKDTIIKEISKEIESLYNKQIKSLEKIENYYNDWRKSYENEDLDGMEKAFTKILKESQKITPSENIQKQINTIENINTFVKNNNEFNLSDEELELATKI